jgi:hypothetical protein
VGDRVTERVQIPVDCRILDDRQLRVDLLRLLRPISTSCCCEMPHAADIPPKAAIAAPATNRLIVSILSD